MGKPADGEPEKLELSGSALAALRDFYSEREQREQRFHELKVSAGGNDSNVKWSMELFAEDWNASQFWYSEDTATRLAKELLKGATSETHIALVSAPSVFIQLKNLLSTENWPLNGPRICLLELDKRFDIFPEFVQYNFERPLQLDEKMKGIYDRILCDPPFLSSDCQTKAAMTVRWLSKTSSMEQDTRGTRIIVCTGERMEGIIRKLYPGIQTTTFEPRHAQNRLSNDFRCYANFDSDMWSFT